MKSKPIKAAKSRKRVTTIHLDYKINSNPLKEVTKQALRAAEAVDKLAAALKQLS